MFPADKEQILRILQSRGHVLAIVGDGIKDRPALKIANCGIAADKASASARSAADMVQFNQGGLGLLIQAIQISRQALELFWVWGQYTVSEQTINMEAMGIFYLHCFYLYYLCSGHFRWSFKFFVPFGTHEKYGDIVTRNA